MHIHTHVPVYWDKTNLVNIVINSSKASLSKKESTCTHCQEMPPKAVEDGIENKVVQASMFLRFMVVEVHKVLDVVVSSQ